MSTTTPFASLYVTVLDDEAGARNAIDCALVQSCEPVEVVVVDAGSTTDSFDVVSRDYREDPRVRIVAERANGVGAASNLALGHCRAPLVARVRTNAHVAPDAVALLAVPHVDETVAVTCGGIRIADRFGNVVPGPFIVGPSSRFVMIHGWIAHPLRLFSRVAWERTGGFDESLTVEPDYDMFLKLSEVASVAYEFAQTTALTFPGDPADGLLRGGQRRDHITSLHRALIRRGHMTTDGGDDATSWGLPTDYITITVPASSEASVEQMIRERAPVQVLSKETVDAGVCMRTPALSPSRAGKLVKRLTRVLAPYGARVELGV